MLKKINECSWFEELYCLLFLIIGIISYCLNPIIGLIFIIILTSIAIIVFNDFKYTIPAVLFFIFSNSNIVTTKDIPIPFAITVIVFILVLVFFMIKNKPDLKKIKSGKGIFLLGVVSILPLFWHNIIPKDSGFLYFLYLSYIFYFLLYAITSSSLKKDSFRMLTKSMTYTGLLIALECFYLITKYKIENPEANILSYQFHAGWGICNEAGIMLCVSLPFMFISLINKRRIYMIVIELFKIIIVIVGMILTNSRGTYLFGFIELGLLALWTLIRAKRRWSILISAICLLIIAYFTIELTIGVEVVLTSIKELVFYNDLNDNGRYQLWRMAYDIWNQDFVRMTFGSGIVGEYYADNIRYVVYHSTFFQALANVGNLGVAFLIIHFVEKYKQLKKLDITTMVILLISYISVDLYGMIDNTYGMYYYMLPLMLIMGTIDNIDKKDQSLQLQLE